MTNHPNRISVGRVRDDAKEMLEALKLSRVAMGANEAIDAMDASIAKAEGARTTLLHLESIWRAAGEQLESIRLRLYK